MAINITFSAPTNTAESPISTTPISVGVDFGEPVNGFDITDISVSLSSVQLSSITGSDGDQSYMLHFDLPLNALSSFTITIAANRVTSVSSPIQQNSITTSNIIYFDTDLSTIPSGIWERTLTLRETDPDNPSSNTLVDIDKVVYMVEFQNIIYGTTDEAFYTVNLETFVCTRIGTFNRPNVVGIAADNTNLYLFTSTPQRDNRGRAIASENRLIRINTSGVQTRILTIRGPDGTRNLSHNAVHAFTYFNGTFYVDLNELHLIGSIDFNNFRIVIEEDLGFGVNEHNPTSLIWVTDRYIFTGEFTNNLYSLDPTTQNVTTLVDYPGGTANDNYFAGLTYDGTNIWIRFTSGSARTRITRLNLSGQTIDSLEIVDNEGDPLNTPGEVLSVDTNYFYIFAEISSGVNRFYRINRTSGRRESLGDITLEIPGIAGSGYGISDLEFRNGILYALTEEAEIWQVNINNGTLSNRVRLEPTQTQRLSLSGLAWNGTNFVVLNDFDDDIGIVNFTTGDITWQQQHIGLGIGEGNFIGLTSDTNNLYIYGQTHRSLLTINPSTHFAQHHIGPIPIVSFGITEIMLIRGVFYGWARTNFYRLLISPEWSNIPNIVLQQGETETLNLSQLVLREDTVSFIDASRFPNWITIGDRPNFILTAEHPGPIIREIEYDPGIRASNTAGDADTTVNITAEGVYKMWIPIPELIGVSEGSDITRSIANYLTSSESTVISFQGTQPPNWIGLSDTTRTATLTMDPPTTTTLITGTFTLRAVDGSNQEDLIVGYNVVPVGAAAIEENYLIAGIEPTTITSQTATSTNFIVQFNRTHPLTGDNRVEVSDFIAESPNIMASVNTVTGVANLDGDALDSTVTETAYYEVNVTFPAGNTDGDITLSLRAE